MKESVITIAARLKANLHPIHEKKFLDFKKKNLDEIKTVVLVALRLHKTQHQSNF